jgi:hypothetical protein
MPNIGPIPISISLRDKPAKRYSFSPLLKTWERYQLEAVVDPTAHRTWRLKRKILAAAVAVVVLSRLGPLPYTSLALSPKLAIWR